MGAGNFVSPGAGDDLDAIAARVLPNVGLPWSVDDAHVPGTRAGAIATR